MTEQIKEPLRAVRRYSQSFKQKVVEELESGKASIQSIRRKYGINGTNTLHRWVKQMGKNHLLCCVVRIETPQDMDEKEQLRQRIKELEKGLVQTQLNYLQSESYLSLACQQLGVEAEEFKKKPSSEPRTGRAAKKQ
jgi:transposase-like protein